MSKLAQKAIKIPNGTTVTVSDKTISIKGGKGILQIKELPSTVVSIENNAVSVSTTGKNKQSRSNLGTMWSLINNAIIGVTDGFSKVLEVEGVGFRVALEGNKLILNVGFSHSVEVKLPDGIETKVEKNTIHVSGIDKILVGQIAANIRAVKKPEPYKGKGIRYRGEIIRRKAGKKVVGTTT